MRSLRCRLGFHDWRRERTEEGEERRRCSRCHRDGPGPVEAPVDDAYSRARGFFGGSA